MMRITKEAIAEGIEGLFIRYESGHIALNPYIRLALRKRRKERGEKMTVEYEVVRLEKRIGELEQEIKETRQILSKALNFMPISPIGLKRLQKRLEERKEKI
jgi:hypothetical protein